MDHFDQMKVANWIKTRAEKAMAEATSLIYHPDESKDKLEQLATECRAHGKALGLMELARDVLDSDWLSVVTSESGVD